MMRSIPFEWTLFGQGPWDYTVNRDFIYNFWVEGAERAKPYEGIFTVGMRGDGDGERSYYRVLKVESDMEPRGFEWRTRHKFNDRDHQRSAPDLYGCFQYFGRHDHPTSLDAL